MSLKEAIRLLKRVSCSTGIGLSFTTENNSLSVEQEFIGRGLKDRETERLEMLNVISEVEKQFPDSGSYELEFALGTALRNYTSWYIRGDARKQPLQKAIQHYEKAYALSKELVSNDSDPLPKIDERDFVHFNRNAIACIIGKLFVNEPIIRDLEKGISYLETVFNNTTDYDPGLCAYAEAYYKLGNYTKSAEIALEVHHRAEKEEIERMNDEKIKGMIKRYNLREVPYSGLTAPMMIFTKAIRAKAKEYKKKGEVEQAISSFQKLVDLNLATSNDKKILEKLQTLRRK